MSAPRKQIMEPGFAPEWLNFAASLPQRYLAGVSLGLALIMGGLCPVAGEEATAILEAGFGKAEIDLKSPRMTSLWLRQSDGSLTAKSLLAADLGGCTYLVGWTAPADARGDRRFESSTSRAHRVRVTRGADNTVSKVVLEGILPSHDAPAVEDWEIALSPAGAELVWKVTRTWRRPFQVRVSGTPALFLGPFGGEGGYDPKRPAVTSTLWYEPGRILGETHPHWPEGMYLADLVVTSASLVNGILGIHPTWDKLEVEPCLPSGWDSATATVIYKGVRHTVTIRNGQATVTPKDRVYDFSAVILGTQPQHTKGK